MKRFNQQSDFSCRGPVYTNLEVNTVLRTAPHAETCTADDCILYKMEKRNTLKRHAREETKPVPQIYNEGCSNASTSLETAGQLPTFKSVKSARYRSRAKRFPPLPATRQQLEIPAHCRVTKSGRQFLIYNNRKIYGNWLDSLSGAWTEHLKLFLNGTSNCSPFIGSVRGCPSAANYHLRLRDCPYPCSAGTFPGVLVQDCYFHFCQVVLRKVADLELRTRYLHEAEIKKIIKMLMATAFLPLAEVPDAVDLHGRDVTGSVAALFEYFREECMTCNRMPLWNVYHVETSTNNHLEVWHFKMNRQAGRRHLSFYELLRLLIDEQGSTATLIQQVISGCVTVNDLRVKNKYEEVQLRLTALTAEYDGGTHAIEQFLKAIAYDVPELFIFVCIVESFAHRKLLGKL
ncbi:hypothetical protein T09_12967 [Trichinella sp. T9]|nr:hypothetical protein T09_12967 [Trichinella sp. T9]